MEDAFAFFKLGKSARLAAVAGFFAAGALLQILFPWGTVPGFILIAAGWAPLALKAVTNKPADLGLEEWRPVSMTEVDRLADTLRQSKESRLRSAGGLVGAVALSIFLLVAAGITRLVGRSLSLLFADAFLFLVPSLFFGGMRVFVPRLLDVKMPCFQALFEEKASDELVLTPYFRFDKDKEGRDVPEDLRVMIEPKRKPEDFVGVQIQAAVNKGPNGEVPYLYAVFLTEGKGRSWTKLSSARPGGYVLEKGGDGKYGSVVMRQETSGGGYATKPSDCARLYDKVKETLTLLEG
ncbi:MAG: hypothetical protein NT061_04300 [Spirochaetes bacterium]|nr:hypothetical protein [Spirochaetota bacterium]